MYSASVKKVKNTPYLCCSLVNIYEPDEFDEGPVITFQWSWVRNDNKFGSV